MDTGSSASAGGSGSGSGGGGGGVGGAGRFADTIEQIRLAVDGEWESLSMTLREHRGGSFGDPGKAGTAAWHVRHIAEIFRVHARHLIGETVEGWPTLPGVGGGVVEAEAESGWEFDGIDPGVLEVLRGDVARLTAWAEGGGLSGGVGECGDGGGGGGGVEIAEVYGDVRSVSEMLGVMLRHVVWHAAAAHYWCRWVRDR